MCNVKQEDTKQIWSDGIFLNADEIVLYVIHQTWNQDDYISTG